MQTVPTDTLAAAESHVQANMHWFNETDNVATAPSPSIDESTVYVLGPDQHIELPNRVKLTGPGFIDIGVIGEESGNPWYRIYFVQGVNQRGRPCAYDLSGT